MATIKDLARIAGVSIGTVSNVINGKKTVNPEIRKKVERAIKLTDYKVNLHARGMKMSKSFNIAIIVPSILDPFFPNLTDAIEMESEKLGMNVLISSSHYSAEREVRMIERMLAKNVDGIILIPESDTNMLYVKKQIDNDTPFVLLSRRYQQLNTPYVVADNQSVSREALSYLADRGHERIGFMVSPLMNSADRDRLAGVRLMKEELRGRADVGILYCEPLPEDDRDHSMEHQMTQGYRKGIELIDRRELPAAVFANNDYIAVGLMKACTDRGVRIPDDLAVLGVSNQFPRELLIKQLSTFDPHARTMGIRAVQILKDLMDHPGTFDTDRHQVEIGMTFVEGRTA